MANRSLNLVLCVVQGATTVHLHILYGYNGEKWPHRQNMILHSYLDTIQSGLKIMKMQCLQTSIHLHWK